MLIGGDVVGAEYAVGVRLRQVPQRGIVGGHIAVKRLLLAVGEGKIIGVDRTTDGGGSGGAAGI